MEYSVNPPDVVIRPILLTPFSVNHNAPSGPNAIPKGSLPAVGVEYSVSPPEVVIRPILLPICSVNHNAPSGPDAMDTAPLFDCGMEYSVRPPEVVIRPILLLLHSVNHNAPSGPDAMPQGKLLKIKGLVEIRGPAGREYSVNPPEVVIRPILLPSCSVNHSA